MCASYSPTDTSYSFNNEVLKIKILQNDQLTAKTMKTTFLKNLYVYGILASLLKLPGLDICSFLLDSVVIITHICWYSINVLLTLYPWTPYDWLSKLWINISHIV